MVLSTFDALDATRTLGGADLEQLATRADLNGVETALTAELQIVRWAMALQGAVSLATPLRCMSSPGRSSGEHRDLRGRPRRGDRPRPGRRCPGTAGC